MRWETKEPQKCPKKKETDWRLMVVNVNNFPTEYNGHEKAKYDILKQETTSSGADVIGITELGRNENNLPNQLKPSNIVKNGTNMGLPPLRGTKGKPDLLSNLEESCLLLKARVPLTLSNEEKILRILEGGCG
jgi:hypothetical protein